MFPKAPRITRYAAAVAASVSAIAALLLVAMPVYAQNECRSGAVALGNAYVRANPMYAMFFGDLESYVAENRGHFVEGGDAIRCARLLSRALTNQAIGSYDPEWRRSQDELRAELGAMGISSGPQQASPSAQLYAMGQQISRLARVLPAAAVGDYGPLRTPTTEEERMRLFGAQMLQMLLQDPTVRQAFIQTEPLIRQAAEAEYGMLVGMAQQLGQ